MCNGEKENILETTRKQPIEEKPGITEAVCKYVNVKRYPHLYVKATSRNHLSDHVPNLFSSYYKFSIFVSHYYH